MDSAGLLKEIDEVFADWDDLKRGSKHDDASDQPAHLRRALEDRAATTIDRLAPPGSQYRRSMQDIVSKKGYIGALIPYLMGCLLALRKDIEKGRIRTFTEIVHADTFASFLDMAEHLLQQGYKDAAAVIAGSTLEQHLRDLAIKHAISAQTPDGKFRKADSLNADLATASAITKLDQKAVTSWLGLRNEAAHGNYVSYTPEQVRLMAEGVRDFARRYPA